MASSPLEGAKESDVTPAAEETLNFDDATLKGGTKREQVHTVEMLRV